MIIVIIIIIIICIFLLLSLLLALILFPCCFLFSFYDLLIELVYFLTFVFSRISNTWMS